MSEAIQEHVKATPATSLLTPAHTGMLQRRCACGGPGGDSSHCQKCKDEQHPLQRFASSRSPRSLFASASSHQPRFSPNLGHSFARVKIDTRSPRYVQPKLAFASSSDLHEQEADQAAQLVTAASAHSNGKSSLHSKDVSAQPLIESAPVDETVSADQQAVSPEPALPEPAPEQGTAEKTATEETATEEDAAEKGGAGTLIVEDDARQLSSDQMRKSELFDELQTAICAAADAELASVGRSAEGCPYIEKWIGYYRDRPAQYVERALRKYAPEAAGARTARDYIPVVTERVRRAASVWATTGEITGVPDELASQVPADPMLGAAAGAARSAAKTAVGIFTKAREGGAKQAEDPRQIQEQLTRGESLEGGVRSKMESAFGHDFSRVRVHTNSQAASLSNQLNARAFTIGSDIAFGSGEYQPGTVVGDALLAHELAHVVQQAGGSSFAAPQQKGAGEYNSLEEDADRSAVGAVVSIWTGAKKNLSSIGKDAMPRLKSGLRLSRCKNNSTAGANKNMDGVDLGPTDASKMFCRKGAFKESYTVGSNTTTAAVANSVIEFEGENTGTKDSKACSCDCGFLRQYIRGYWIRGSGGSKNYSVKSCGNALTMNETTWIEEYMACDPQADKCKQRYTDNPGWSSGLSEGDYIELVYEFKFELWDHCQGKAETTTFKKATLKGDKAPRTITWT